MISFPSAFVLDKTVNTSMISGNLTESAKNMFEAVIHDTLHSKNSDSGASIAEIGERIDWHDFNYDNSIKATQTDINNKLSEIDETVSLLTIDNVANDTELKMYTVGAAHYPKSSFYKDAIQHSNGNKTSRVNLYENAFNIPADVLKDINKYRYVKQEAVIERAVANVIGEGTSNEKTKVDKKNKQTKAEDTLQDALVETDDNIIEYSIEAVTSSLFNPWYAVKAAGITMNTPKMHTIAAAVGEDTVNTNKSLFEEYANTESGITVDWSKKFNAIQGFTLEYNPNNTELNNLEAARRKQTEHYHGTLSTGNLKNDDKANGGVNSNNSAGELEAYKDIVGKANKNKIDNIRVVGENESIKENVKVDFSLSKSEDFTDCSIKTLIKLSGGKGDTFGSKNDFAHAGKLGRSTYRYIDFLYCRDVGKIPNNHLITLRRFSHPVGDNIYKVDTNTLGQTIPQATDIGHLVTWFGTEDNKLEDICKFSMSTSYREMNAKIQDVDRNDNENENIGASIFNLTNPQYWNMVRNGTAGSENWFLNRAANTKLGSLLFSSKGQYESKQFHRDANKVWEKKNTIQTVNYYEGKIQFAHEFSLVFNYEIRHYDGINGKSAFLDLVGQILRVCHVEGGFWGGSINFHGRGHTPGWHKMNNFLNKLEKGAMNAIDEILGINSWQELGEWCMNLLNSAMDWIKNVYDQAVEMLTTESGRAKIKAKAGQLLKGAVKMGIGMMKNKLGRPAIYATDSLLNGGNTGLWHVTVGNPRNPILSFGNLILSNAELQHYGPLGIDDFPTKIKLTCSMKHARPRAISHIASMYTCGQGGLVLKMSEKHMTLYHNMKDVDTLKDLGFGLEVHEANNMQKYDNKDVSDKNTILTALMGMLDYDFVDAIYSNTP